MAAPHPPLTAYDGGQYFPPPYSAFDLGDLRSGLIALGVLAVMSAASTLALLGFIVSRFITWRTHYKTFIGYNQYVILVFNLLIADFLQSASFLISWHWYRFNAILAPSPACFAQAWLLHSGDMSSGLFVLAIAMHTFYTAVYGQRVSNKLFYCVVAVLWSFAFFLTAIGVGVHRKKYFVRAGAWCWISTDYENFRLWCHYFWIFLIEFGTIAIYVVTFWSLRRKTAKYFNSTQLSTNSGHAATLKAVNRVTMLMTLYPCLYVILTLPLSAGRMWSMAHDGKATSDAYSLMAGSLLTSCGWVDSLLYTLTRKRLLQDTMPDHSPLRSSRARDEVSEHKRSIVQTRTVTVETDGLSDFELAHPGADHLTSYYNIGSAEDPSPRIGTVEHHAPLQGTNKVVAVHAAKSLLRPAGVLLTPCAHEHEDQTFPGSLPSLMSGRDQGWTRLASEDRGV